MNRMIPLLGKMAYWMREARLGWLLEIGRDLADTVLIKLGYPPLQVKISGITIHGYLRHRSFLEGLLTGQYEAFTRELYEDALRPGMVVVDAGAHIGLYSLLAAKKIGCSGKIFAFEPDPYNFEALVFNIKSNKCHCITPVRKAVSHTIGKISFYKSLGTISSSLFNRKNIGKVTMISVSSTTLDEELRGLDIRSILIKLDIEGAEPLALDGMRNILHTVDSVVLIAEVNPSALRDAGFSPDTFISMLKMFGFRIYFIDESNKRLVPITSPTVARKGNLYCVK